MELNAKISSLTVEASSGVDVLEPFDTTVKYSRVSGKQHIHVGLSEIYTNFSFSVIQLILKLQEDVMSFLRITSEQITVECSEFDRVWANEGTLSAVNTGSESCKLPGRQLDNLCMLCRTQLLGMD